MKAASLDMGIASDQTLCHIERENERKMMELREPYQCWIDSDGVLKDFDRHVLEFTGKYPDQQPDDEMWALLNSCPNEFWPTMPMMYGAMELWEFLQPKKPIILTGCHKDLYEEIAAHKVATAKRDFGEDVNIVTCLSRNKPLHMKNPGDILIDDMSRNTRRWIKAGGRAVHYRTHEQGMSDLKAMLSQPWARDRARLTDEARHSTVKQYGHMGLDADSFQVIGVIIETEGTFLRLEGVEPCLNIEFFEVCRE